MNSTFFRQKTHTGFSKPGYHKKSHSRFSFVGMLSPDSGSAPYLDAYGDTPLDRGGDVPYSDPKYEIDFSALSCDKLLELINDLTSFMQSARLTQTAAGYYIAKLDQMKAAYAGCTTKPTSAPTGGSAPTPDTSTPTPTPTPSPTPPLGTPILIPVLPIKDDSGPSGGGTSATFQDSGLGGGAGGGGGAGDGAKKKKFNWWIVVAAAALAIAGYQTNKQPG